MNHDKGNDLADDGSNSDTEHANPQPQPEHNKTLDEILQNYDTWCSCGKKECPKSENYDSDKAAILAWAREQCLEIIGEDLEFKPKKNRACSFEQAEDAPNPCKYCGGTRKYEWRVFTEKNGFTPNELNGYNLAKEKLRKQVNSRFGGER